MNEELKLVLQMMRESNEHLSEKFDRFFQAQEQVNDLVRQHDVAIKSMQESAEKKIAERHPILMKAVELVISVAFFLAVAHFAPNIAKLLVSI